MIDKTLLAAMMASADQAMAKRRDDIGRLIEQYKQIKAQRHDPVVASGLLILASIATLDQIEACQLLGTAVMMLAEAPEGGA